MDAVEWAVNKRQVLDGILGDLTSLTDGVTSAVGGALGGGDDIATSTADGDGGLIPTLPVSSDSVTSTSESKTSTRSSSSSEPTSSSATSTSSSSSSASPSSSSSISSASSSSSLESSSSSSSSSSSTTSSSSSVSTSSAPSSTSSETFSTPPPITTITDTDAGGAQVTSVVTATASADPSVSSGNSDADNASPVGANAFLQNKVLSGVVFGIAGLVGLIILIFLTTWYMRRTRKKNFLDEAVSFEPQSHGYTGDDMTRGLTQASNRNSVSSGKGSLRAGLTYRPDAPAMPAYHQQQPYYGAMNGAEAYPTYAAPSQIAGAMNTYDNPGMAEVNGGASGIKRKYSNVSRVPVPNNVQDPYGGYRQ